MIFLIVDTFIIKKNKIYVPVTILVSGLFIILFTIIYGGGVGMGDSDIYISLSFGLAIFFILLLCSPFILRDEGYFTKPFLFLYPTLLIVLGLFSFIFRSPLLFDALYQTLFASIFVIYYVAYYPLKVEINKYQKNGKIELIVTHYFFLNRRFKVSYLLNIRTPLYISSHNKIVAPFIYPSPTHKFHKIFAVESGVRQNLYLLPEWFRGMNLVSFEKEFLPELDIQIETPKVFNRPNKLIRSIRILPTGELENVQPEKVFFINQFRDRILFKSFLAVLILQVLGLLAGAILVVIIITLFLSSQTYFMYLMSWVIALIGGITILGFEIVLLGMFLYPLTILLFGSPQVTLTENLLSVNFRWYRFSIDRFTLPTASIRFGNKDGTVYLLWEDKNPTFGYPIGIKK